MLTTGPKGTCLARRRTASSRSAGDQPDSAAASLTSPDASVLVSIDALFIVAAQLRERAALVTENRRAELLALAAEYDQLARMARSGRKHPSSS